MSNKMCFLVLAHSHFQQLNRLLNSLDYPGFDVYLHVDAKSSYQGALPKNVSLIQPSVICQWGSFSLVQATLELLRAAKDSGIEYRYYTLLSGVDYPVRSNDDIHRKLAESDSEFLDIYQGKNDFRHDWYRKHHLTRFPYWPRRLVHMFLHRMQGRVLPDKHMPMSMQPYWGSQWWSLSHAAIQYVFDFMMEHPKYLPFFKFSHAPDEMFFHTIILNSSFKSKMKPNLHYIDWKKGGSHPKVLGENDFEAFSTGDWLFARKFDLDATPGLLDRIDRELRQ